MDDSKLQEAAGIVVVWNEGGSGEHKSIEQFGKTGYSLAASLPAGTLIYTDPIPAADHQGDFDAVLAATVKCGVRLHSDVPLMVNGIQCDAPWEILCQPQCEYKFEAIAQPAAEQADAVRDMLVEALKDAHPYIDNPHVRIKIGAALKAAGAI